MPHLRSGEVTYQAVCQNTGTPPLRPDTDLGHHRLIVVTDQSPTTEQAARCSDIHPEMMG